MVPVQQDVWPGPADAAGRVQAALLGERVHPRVGQPVRHLRQAGHHTGLPDPAMC